MIGLFLWLIYLLIQVPNMRCLVADDDWVQAWFSATKIEFWWKICTLFKVMEQ